MGNKYKIVDPALEFLQDAKEEKGHWIKPFHLKRMDDGIVVQREGLAMTIHESFLENPFFADMMDMMLYEIKNFKQEYFDLKNNKHVGGDVLADIKKWAPKGSTLRKKIDKYKKKKVKK